MNRSMLMESTRFTTFRAFCLGFVLLCLSLPLRAEQFGLFSYEVVNGATVTITHYPDTATGPVEIPAEIAGKPVTSIGAFTFYDCELLSSVTIPASVTSIGAFAFRDCERLTSVTIPASVTSLGDEAFENCILLKRAFFLGNAPRMGKLRDYEDVFHDKAEDFTIYYLSSRFGFTDSSVFDEGVMSKIDEATYPAASWLLTHGMWYYTNLNQDPDGDGVVLLMAYALNLDPRLDMQGGLPVPVLGADTLSLSFYAKSRGITYKVESSRDLQTWTSQGVTQSAPGADGRATASVPREAPNQFLRLVVRD